MHQAEQGICRGARKSREGWGRKVSREPALLSARWVDISATTGPQQGDSPHTRTAENDTQEQTYGRCICTGLSASKHTHRCFTDVLPSTQSWKAFGTAHLHEPQ
jgi:hypothetical protein